LVKREDIMTKPRILLADDHRLVREGIRNLLKADYEVVAEAGDGRELVRAAIELRPDVIVADIGMPSLNGLEAIRKIKKRGVEAKIIFVTMHAGVDFAVQAFRLGVSGYVLKVDASEELVRALKEALAGRLYITPSIAQDVMTALMESPKRASEDDEPWSRLTAREREVLQLVAEGHKMTEIGEILHISARTVERHKYSLKSILVKKLTFAIMAFSLSHANLAFSAEETTSG
jgi:DNA-binding NarL/FixJ family response regulator